MFLLGVQSYVFGLNKIQWIFVDKIVWKDNIEKC